MVKGIFCKDNKFSSMNCFRCIFFLTEKSELSSLDLILNFSIFQILRFSDTKKSSRRNFFCYYILLLIIELLSLTILPCRT